MELSRFDYHLPPEAIAQEPLADRAASRMLVLHRADRRWEDRAFRDLPEYLGPGDCLVFNDSRVFPSRLYGHRLGCQGRVEVFLVRPRSADLRRWEALVRPGRKMRVGETVIFSDRLQAKIAGRGGFHGERILEFEFDGDFHEIVSGIGHVPLPLYIKRPDTAADRERYQTVFARKTGSVAAPTAGLHFTKEILDRCRERGACATCVTLHVGLGTFQPLHEENLASGALHPEYYEIAGTPAAQIRAAHRVVAVGTTVVRTLESGPVEARRGDTTLFIQPGFEFRTVGAMLTNFHLPQSSLLMLVCAFAGTEFVLEAYRHAVEAEYRFYSYGDCMLIL